MVMKNLPPQSYLQKIWWLATSAECKITLVGIIMPSLNAVVFRYMALKGQALYVRLWEFDRERLKNNANKDRR